ncbi:MAG: hypothetical protein PWP53_408 [Lacrimispora sp.]|nr:hypothetical protein [Lacrimispora sp.]
MDYDENQIGGYSISEIRGYLEKNQEEYLNRFRQIDRKKKFNGAAAFFWSNMVCLSNDVDRRILIMAHFFCNYIICFVYYLYVNFSKYNIYQRICWTVIIFTLDCKISDNRKAG